MLPWCGQPLVLCAASGSVLKVKAKNPAPYRTDLVALGAVAGSSESNRVVAVPSRFMTVICKFFSSP